MNKSKIEWCDMSWNPVTGCLHGCPYCYARKQARRFTGHDTAPMGVVKAIIDGNHTIYEISSKLQRTTKKKKIVTATFPLGFEPVLHRYRLEEPQLINKPRNIFVCSMADLFGEFIPYEWIDKVLDVCNGAPQHRFLFLTKNPKRYMELYSALPKGNNFFYGTTVTTADTEYWYSESHNWFLSIEPIMEKFPGHSLSGSVPLMDGPGIRPKWVIVGAETGKRKGKVIPKREWIETIVEQCRFWKIPVFLKNNLAQVWGEPLIQEYPWIKGVKNGC